MKKLFSNMYLSLTTKRKKNIVQKFNGVLANAKNFIVLMPENEHDFLDALEVTGFLLSKKIHVTLVANNLAMHVLKDKSPYRLEEYFPTDKNKFGFPKRKLVNRLKIYSYDALLALEKEVSPFQNYLADKIQTEIKIGTASPGNDKIYSVQIANGENAENDSYKIFLNCLQLLY